jgi:hypothetical protein
MKRRGERRKSKAALVTAANIARANVTKRRLNT